MNTFKILKTLGFCTFPMLVASCDNKKAATTVTVEAKEKEIVWDWKNFPQASSLSLRTMPLDMQPKQLFQIKSEAHGIITLEILEKNTRVKEGDIIGRMDVKTLSEQEIRLRIQEERQLIEEMKEDKLTGPERRKKAVKELEAARKKLKTVEHVLNSPAMAEIAAEIFGPEYANVNKKSLAEAKEALSLAEKKMSLAEKYDKILRDGQKEIQSMDLAKSKRTLQDAKDRSVYKVPFDGELRLEVNFIKGQDEYTVGGRETIATLSDYEEIYGYLKVANSKWVNLQPERLHIQLLDKDKTLLKFNDDVMAKDLRTQREERKYIFSIPLKSNKALKRLVGTQMQGELIYTLPEVCYIVPKFDLSLYALGKTKSLDWSVMVTQLWPGAKVLAEGRKNLAIKF